MIVVDEYVVLKVVSQSTDVSGLPDETMGLPYLRHWRLVSTLAKDEGSGRLSRALAQLSHERRRFIEQPDARLVQIIDPRPLILPAGRAHGLTGGLSALMAETVPACLHYESALYIGDPQNGTGALADKVRSLGIDIVVV